MYSGSAVRAGGERRFLILGSVLEATTLLLFRYGDEMHPFLQKQLHAVFMFVVFERLYLCFGVHLFTSLQVD